MALLNRGKGPVKGLALVDFPVPVGVESHLEKAVLGIVSIAATGAHQITAPGRSLAIVVFRYGKRCAAAAGHEKHPQWRLVVFARFGLA